jgi:diacylglycerol O-acyltransferase
LYLQEVGWVKRLNGVDAMLLYSETAQIHMHTLKIGVLDVGDVEGGFSFDLFRRVAYPQLLALAPLRYQLVDVPLKLHHPMWQENADIDLDYHLQQLRVPSPGGRRELDQLIGQVAGTPLDRRRPLWQMYVAEGLSDDRVAVIHKVHHALADGVASANQMAKAMNPVSDVAPDDVRPPLTREEVVTASSLLRAAGRDHVRQIRRLPKLLRETGAGVLRVRRRSREREMNPELARNFAPPPTFINHVVSPGRRFATAPLALAEFKETSKHLGVTINDLVLAMVAGALRELLMSYDGHADAPLIAGVPVSFDTSPDRLAGNEYSYMTPSLPVHIAEPLERVRLTALSTGIAKENFHLLGPTVIASWLAYLPPAVAPAAFSFQSKRVDSSAIMNLTVSNVPGPKELGCIGGATISEIYSVGPLVAGSGMNITVWSYVDQLNISVLTDDLTCDDPHEATDAMIRSFAEIRSAAGFVGNLTKVETAMPVASAAG